ncbi:MAG: hypothetical protein P4L70_00760 [Parasulfuritortus sp.]|nr:hypothetical protein [Parasulfuritortus sp.]
MKLVTERQHEVAMMSSFSHPSSLNRLLRPWWARTEQFCFDLALQRYSKAQSQSLTACQRGANSEDWMPGVWR